LQRSLSHLAANLVLDFVSPLQISMGAFFSKPSFTERTSTTEDESDKQILCDLLIVGTHDSGAFNCRNALAAWVNCQSLSITQQLTAGVRFLDIRGCLTPKNELIVCHGKFNLGSSVKHVIGECIAFLNAHPTEFILFKLQNENCLASKGTQKSYIEYTSCVRKLIAENPDIFWRNESGKDNCPNLGQVRGKIVLFDRFGSGDRTIGLNFSLVNQRRDRPFPGLFTFLF
jgi:1-phosphatidylinositol phosphodiesterase